MERFKISMERIPISSQSSFTLVQWYCSAWKALSILCGIDQAFAVSSETGSDVKFFKALAGLDLGVFRSHICFFEKQELLPARHSFLKYDLMISFGRASIKDRCDVPFSVFEHWGGEQYNSFLTPFESAAKPVYDQTTCCEMSDEIEVLFQLGVIIWGRTINLPSCLNM